MKVKTFLFLCFFSLSIFIGTFAQNNDSTLVQFSGIIVTDDSLRPIPFVSIMVSGTYRGTMSDFNGFFSIAARKNETISFSCMGFKTIFYTIPDTLSSDRYSIIQIMREDTIYLDETFIYPWPTYEQFKQAFVTANIPDDDLERAKKNLSDMENRLNNQYMAMDGSMNYRNWENNNLSTRYYTGQMQPISVLNPLAWIEFFKAWKDGKFKRKEKNTY